MEYRSLGRTGIQVSPLCLGAMMFGGWGEPDHETSIATIHSALDAGINFIDTADAYSQGESEIIVGKALAGGRRDDVVLATKVNIQMGVPVDAPVGTRGDPNKRGNSRRWIVSEVENSLRRLNTDWIDLYQIHRPDPYTDIEETLVEDCSAALTAFPRTPVQALYYRPEGGRIHLSASAEDGVVLDLDVRRAAAVICDRFVTV